MKQFYFLIIAAALAFAACKPDVPQGPKYPVPEPGTSYVLEGTVKTEGFSWKTNSVLGLYSAMEEIKLINKECKIIGWANTDPIIDEETGENTNEYTPSEYEGLPVARFNTPALDLVSGENHFMVYSPYNPDLSFVKDVIYGLNIDDQQVQTAPNVAADCFSFGTAVGIPGVDAAFAFELNPVTAVAKVKLSSTEYGKFAPKKVTIYDDANSALAGGFNINVTNMEITRVGEPLDRVSVELVAEQSFETVADQNIYLNILPVDFTGKDLWIVIELVDAQGARITVPTKKSDLKFEAGKVTEIDLSGLSSEMNAAGDWYAATETRLLAGDGVAYGDANTYFIQCKSGSTYTGATYAANSNIPDEVVIDYRARGNFYNAVAPEGVTFDWARTSNGNVYIPRTNGYTASAVDPTKFTFTVDEAKKTVTVKNTGAFAGSPILLMMKDGRVLWAWTFWNVAADGTSVTPVTIGEYGFAPMDIGQPTTNMDAWIANKNGTKPDPMFRMTHFYQWGRPVPIFWTSYWSVDGLGAAGNVPATEGPISLYHSLSTYPGLIVNKVEEAANWKNWCTESLSLWGCNDVKKEGSKSIYDPCPKGYRVASIPAYNALAALSANVTFSDETGKVSASVNNLTLITQGRQTGKISAAGGRPSNMGLGDAADANACKEGMVWGNVAGTSQGQGFWYTSNKHATVHAFRVASQDRSNACAVRCIVDKDNR